MGEVLILEKRMPMAHTSLAEIDFEALRHINPMIRLYRMAEALLRLPDGVIEPIAIHHIGMQVAQKRIPHRTIAHQDLIVTSSTMKPGTFLSEPPRIECGFADAYLTVDRVGGFLPTSKPHDLHIVNYFDQHFASLAAAVQEA